MTDLHLSRCLSRLRAGTGAGETVYPRSPILDSLLDIDEIFRIRFDDQRLEPVKIVPGDRFKRA